jgi:hypothetical protein
VRTSTHGSPTGARGRREELRSLALDELDQIAGVIGQLGEVTVHLGVLDA